MRAKCIGSRMALALIIIDVIIMFCVKNCEMASNICSGVLGSAIVSLLLLLTDYFVEKRRAVKRFCRVSYAAVNELNRVKYFFVNEETKIFAKYEYKKKYLDSSFLTRNSFENAVNELNVFYDKYHITNEVVGREFSSKEIEQKFFKNKTMIDEAVASYANINFNLIDDLAVVYDDIYPSIKSIESVYNMLCKKYNELNNQSYEICSYYYEKRCEVSMYSIVDILDKCNCMLFREERYSDNPLCVGVYPAFVTDCRNQLIEIENKLLNSKKKKIVDTYIFTYDEFELGLNAQKDVSPILRGYGVN